MKRGTSGINALLGVDKPLGITSHDVVARVRRLLGERRVGHAGTLDPAASGVLVLGIGQGTRLMGLLTAQTKTYDASICFGTATTTDDAEGDVIARAEVPERLADPALVSVIITSLVGTCEQVPPRYSAISVDGKRSYERARQNEDFELVARTVEIYDAELLKVYRDETGALIWDVRLHTSKGFYVRSCARDLGESLGTYAHLCGLRRVSSGGVELADCVPLAELEQLSPAAIYEHFLNPCPLLGFPERELDEAAYAKLCAGQRMSAAALQAKDSAEDQRFSLLFQHKLVGIWQHKGASLVCDVNFPQGVETGCACRG